MLTILLAFVLGLWLTVLDAYFRDVRLVLPFVLQFVFFFSPVIYPSAVIPPHWRLIFQLNPISGLMDGFRWSLVAGAPPTNAFEIGWTHGILLIGGVTGLVLFARHECIVVDRI